MNYKTNNKTQFIILLLLLIIILLYLLIQSVGYIEHQSTHVPTGNVDIFEIDCSCCTEDNKSVFKEEYTSSSDINENKLKNTNSNSNSSEFVDINNNSDETKNLIVFDNYKIWDNKELRIFANPVYEYEIIIAPGSSNTYTFVIRNNNDFDVVFDIIFKEINNRNINMSYKLRSNGNYIIGTEKAYELINNKKISQVGLPAKSQKSYVLDWKWIDSDNDTQIGFDIDSTYKLSIQIGAN